MAPKSMIHTEFKFGDKVEAFHNNCWWDCHITKYLGFGRFFQCFNNSKMSLSKKLLRAPCQWINQNSVPPHKDMISELPDIVLLHILSFMDTKQAVQTCILSKRWKNLCKRLTSLTCSTNGLKLGVEHFKKFASWILFSRDDSYSLYNLTIEFCVDPELLDRLIEYAIFCNVQYLKMNLITPCKPSFEFLPSIFCCQSLTCLELSIWRYESTITAPKSLLLPMVKRLHLQGVQFIAGDNGSIEPFSNCHMLDTLILKNCHLHNDAHVLCISNSTVSSVAIFGGLSSYHFVLSTPNVSSFTIVGTIGHQLFSTCYLSFLRDATINLYLNGDGDWNRQISTMMQWLQVLYNVKILTLNTRAVSILSEISRPLSKGPQPPRFVRLESLKMKKHLCKESADRQLKRLVKYLLQNSPMDKALQWKSRPTTTHGFPAPSSAAWTLTNSWSNTITWLRKQLSVFTNSRPLPPPESRREFKSGDKVEAFHKHRWWEGYITKDLGKGRFVVSFKDSVEMAFPKELLRTHVTSNRDKISELPDNVLLHIMNFMDTKDAVKTCVLSKRWKHLCKRLTNLTFTPYFKSQGRPAVESFKKFASWVLSSRDDSYSLLNLTIRGWTEPELLDRVTKYALFSNVQQLTMYIYSGCRPYLEFLPLIFCCQSLTSLELWIGWNHCDVILPKSLQLPALKSLLLSKVTFIASDNKSAEPFSNCHVLNNLVLMSCYNNAQVLCISNSSLSSLTISDGQAYQIVLSTPCLSTFTIKGSVSHQLFSTYNLSFLEEVYVDMSTWDEDWDRIKKSPIIIGWLQVLANAKILTLSMHAIRVILRDLSISFPTRPQPPNFVRLESFKVERDLSENISDEELNKVMEYLLLNSQTARVNIIRTA